jgi:hypothetical protein
MSLRPEDPFGARRMSMKRLAVALCLFSLATTAEAYVGPGMGLGVFAAVVGFLTAVLLALAGMVWYPVKRMLRNRRAPATDVVAGGPQSPEQRSQEPER